VKAETVVMIEYNNSYDVLRPGMNGSPVFSLQNPKAKEEKRLFVGNVVRQQRYQ
jgi:hypothetical protein